MAYLYPNPPLQQFGQFGQFSQFFGGERRERFRGFGFAALFAGGFPVGELLLVALRALLLDALEHGISGFQGFVIPAKAGIHVIKRLDPRLRGDDVSLRAPLRCEFALEGVFQQGLAIHLELRAGGFQVFDALVQFRKQLFDFGDDAVLLSKWCKAYG